MMRRPALLLALFGGLALAAESSGCNLITGVGNLTFVNDAGPGGTQAEEGGVIVGGDGGVATTIPAVPSGTQLVQSSTLAIDGITADGYVAYVDTSAGELYVVGVEEPDGGPSSATDPDDLGATDTRTLNVDGLVVEFFTPSTETTAGSSHVGTLNVWTSSLGDPTEVASSVLEPDLTNGFYTVASSADGRYVAYFGPVDPSGKTAPLAVMDTEEEQTTQLLASVSVLEGSCQPKIAFGGAYLVASFCAAPAGGSIDAGLPDGGTNGDLATIASFNPATGKETVMATDVGVGFGLAPNGASAILFGANGLVASPLPGAGAGALVPIDATGTSGIVSNDGTTVYYATNASALKRAKTTAPADPTALAPSSFAFVDEVSNDGQWALGGSAYGSQSGTASLYVASAQQAGAAVTLSSATTATYVQGSGFTSDSAYAVFFTDFGSSNTGTLNAYALAAGGAPFTLGTGAYWAQAALGSTVVFNVNESSGKADLEWRDVAKSSTATLAVAQAGAFFVLGPALDEVVYTYSAGGGSDGLWVLKLNAACNGGGGGPIAYHPPAGAPGSCSAEEVDSFDSNCVANGDLSASCAAVESISTTCVTCLLSDWSSSTWGAVINNPSGGGVSVANAAGCYADQQDVACAVAMQEQLECENNVCASEPDLDSFDTCSSTADTNACACYVANAQGACDAVTTSSCYPGGLTFEESFEAVAPIMCE